MSTVMRELKQFAKIQKAYKEAGKLRVIVGAPNTPHKTAKSITNGRLLIIHEYGTSKIPATHVMSGTLKKQRKALMQGLETDLMAIAKKPSANFKRGFERLASRLEGEVKREFVRGDFPALAPETIRRKGSTKRLIDTGALRQSIQGLVVKSKDVGRYTGEST